MKLRKLFSLAAVALLAGASAFAQESTEKVWPKIYINPGHGTYTANDRPMSTIKHGANNAYTDANNDTTNFFESNTNLQKGFALLDQLVEYGVPFDRTKNQDTTQDRWKIGAARDLTQTNIIMSHVKAGEAPAYTDYAPATGETKDYENPTNDYYNRSLAEIAAEVESWGADMFISIHSNAASEGNTVNYLYFAYDNSYFNSSGAVKEGADATLANEHVAMSKEMSRCGWNHRILDRHTQWSHYDFTMTAADVAAGKGKIGWQNLGVLNHTVPGYLVEGYFHTYQPARHKAMNFGVCRLEGTDYARGVADYFGWELEKTGDIYGIVRDKHEKFTHEYYSPKVGTYDVYKPLNNVTVTLMQGETVVATTKTDDEWNGAFIFNNVAPGDYTLAFTSEEYKADSVWTTDKAKEAVATSIPVTVKAAATSYPTAFLESKTYTAPTVVYVNYPDSTAGKTEYALKAKYKMYGKGEVAVADTLLAGKTVKRQILRDNKLYVLALDTLAEPYIYCVDIATGKTSELDKAAVVMGANGKMKISDIALTADHVLVACGQSKTHYSDDIATTDSETRGDVNFYKWTKNEETGVYGACELWFTTKYSCNYNRCILGNTFAYTGTIADGSIIVSGYHGTHTENIAMRFAEIAIVDGTNAGEQWVESWDESVETNFYADAVSDAYDFELMVSPRGEDNFVFDGNKIAPFEWAIQEGTSVPAVLGRNENIAVKVNGANYFKYAGKSLMVAPDVDAEGLVKGVKMWDVTEGLDKAVEVVLNGAALAAPVKAAYASALGEVKLTLDEVTGVTTDAEIVIALALDGKATIFSATPPPAANVTPATNGTANPFAYGLSGEVADAKLKVNYSLNVDATAVKVVVLNEEGEVVASAEAPAKAGANTAEMSLAAVPTGNYNWGIEVAGEAKTTVAQFVSHVFYHPCGLDVDNSFESPSFGTLFVAEGYTGGKTSGYHSAQADGSDGGGLYIFDPAGKPVVNPTTSGYRFYGEGLTHSNTYHTSTMGADFKNVAIADDGRIFVTRYNSSGDYILSAPSLEELVKAGKFTTSLVAGMTMTDAIYKDAEGNFIVGPMHSFDAKGAGEDTKLIAMTRDVNNAAAGSTNNRVIEYALGEANVIAAGTPVAALDGKFTASYDKTANVVYDNRGGIWYCQYRGTPSDTNPALVYVDAEGNIQYFEGDGGSERRRGSISVSPDGTKLAAAGPGGYLCIFDIEYDEETGEVSLIETFHVKHGMGNNLYALAWDAAGNLYAGNASGEYMNGFSVPRADAFVTKAASKYAFEYENTGIESIESEDVTAPVEYYNLQGVKVANPSNGIFIKKQGDKATKVVL